MKWKEPLLLFHNKARGFPNVSAESGPVFAQNFPARGLGDSATSTTMVKVDVLVSNNDGAPVLLRNNAGKQNHWLGVQLVGRKCNIDAVGARVTYQAGDLKRTQDEGGRRQLSFLPRSADRPWSGPTPEDRLARSEVAATQRRRRTIHGPPDGSLHHNY